MLDLDFDTELQPKTMELSLPEFLQLYNRVKLYNGNDLLWDMTAREFLQRIAGFMRK